MKKEGSSDHYSNGNSGSLTLSPRYFSIAAHHICVEKHADLIVLRYGLYSLKVSVGGSG